MAALILLQVPPAGAQEKADGMVVIVPGSKEYHQPTCPVVEKAGSKVRVSRVSEARRRGLKAHDCPEASGKGAGGDPNKEIVYTQENDNKYHREDCKKLGEKTTELTLEEAGQKLWPCPVCEPPIRQPKPRASRKPRSS